MLQPHVKPDFGLLSLHPAAAAAELLGTLDELGGGGGGVPPELLLDVVMGELLIGGGMYEEDSGGLPLELVGGSIPLLYCISDEGGGM